MVNCHTENCALMVSISLKLLRKQSADTILYYFSHTLRLIVAFIVYLRSAVCHYCCLQSSVLVAIIVDISKSV